ncbi:hypothetical protein SAY86_022943 [Trapa natans]|uniref:Metacaspase-1-like n=1 Tax=Trapa natans TaxID=22666 RepID=A0AAN7LP70_TRANT|nr:hypothetical protein SAY86_022943 [Trapa natans]
MMMLVDCSRCHTPLQLPPGARSIRCTVCHAVTLIAVPPPTQPHSQYMPPSSSFQYYSHPPPPLPYGVAPSPGYHIPSVHGKKRALICGVSYKYTEDELKGCFNDARCMKFLLVSRFKFPESSILLLTEEESDPYRRPTRQNMINAMRWLVQGCQPGDSLVFHFSGHGSQKRNLTGDEIDGFDETLCPVDYKTHGQIVDDEINDIIVRPLPPGAKLHAIIDACHSGTVLDLPFLCRMDRTGKYSWEDHRPRSGRWKGTSGGEVFSFSGCDDNQTSADTSALSKVTSTGAMTYSFIEAIERGHGGTYGSMLNAMRSTINNSTSGSSEIFGRPGGGDLVSSLLTMLLEGGSLASRIRQEPQLTSDQMFDVYKKPFSL